MKNQKSFIPLFSLIVTIFLIYPKVVFSQNLQTALEISKKDKFKYVKKGKKIKIKIKDKKYKFKIDSIGEDFISSKDTSFLIKDIDMIAYKIKPVQISGAVLGTAGLAVTSAGTYLLIEGSGRDFLDGKLILMFLGAFIDVIGVPVTVAGTTLFFAGKKYKKSKGWKLKTVQLE